VPYNRFVPKKPEAAAPPNPQETLLREIRDLLAAQRR
jgi:large-conductance mechanosensitive channel